MSISNLKERLKEIGLSTTGNKATLTDRLEAYNGQGWTYNNGCYYIIDKNKNPNIAAFDFDHTLFKPKNGAIFPIDENDYELAYPTVIPLLKCLTEMFQIVIFTNQGRKTLKHLTLTRLYNAMQELNIKYSIFVSTEDNAYRKPDISMFSLFLSLNDMNVDRKGPNPKTGISENSFYCGDAAGRNNDHDNTDLIFAENCNLMFLVPEQLFVDKEGPIKPFEPVDVNTYTSNKQELIIFIGPPAAGKTTFFNSHFKMNKYVWVNQDALKTEGKTLKITREALRNGESVVIDATNPSKAKRQKYIEIAKEYDIPVRVFMFTVSIADAKKRNNEREKAKISVPRFSQKPVPTIAYSMYSSRFEKPSKDEGIDEIINIHPEKDKVKKQIKINESTRISSEKNFIQNKAMLIFPRKYVLDNKYVNDMVTEHGYRVFDVINEVKEHLKIDNISAANMILNTLLRYEGEIRKYLIERITEEGEDPDDGMFIAEDVRTNPRNVFVQRTLDDINAKNIMDADREYIMLEQEDIKGNKVDEDETALVILDGKQQYLGHLYIKKNPKEIIVNVIYVSIRILNPDEIKKIVKRMIDTLMVVSPQVTINEENIKSKLLLAGID